MKTGTVLAWTVWAAALVACRPENADTDTAVVDSDEPVEFELLLEPGEAGRGATLDVTVRANISTFRFGETTVDLGEGITVESVTVLDVFETVARVLVDPDAPLGAHDVTINVGSLEPYVLDEAFTVIPQSFAVDPDNGKMGETLYVALVGTETAWADGYTFASFGDGVDVLDFTVFSEGFAEARISIRPDAPPGPRDVAMQDGPTVVTHYDGFTVDRAVITAFWDPEEAMQGSQVPFEVTGLDTSFNANSTIEFWDDGGPNADIVVVTQSVQSPTSITGQIRLSNAALLGFRDVLVTSGDEAVLIPDAMEVLDAPPDLSDVIPQLAFDVFRTIDNTNGDILETVQAYAIFFIPLSPPCGASGTPGGGPMPYDINGVWPVPPPPEPVDCPDPETVSAGDFVWFEGPENVVTLPKDIIQSSGQIIYWGVDLTLADYHFDTLYDLHTQGDPEGIPEVLVEDVQPTVPADYYLIDPPFWGDLTVDRGVAFTYQWTPAETYPDAIFGTSISGTLAVDGEPGFAGSLPWDDGSHTYTAGELSQLQPGPVSFSAYSYIRGRYFGLPFSVYQTARSDSVVATDAYMILE